MCKVTWGGHCLYHAYKEKCCARHPQALLKAFRNTQFEKNNSHRYSHIIANSSYIEDELIRAGMDQAQIRVLPYFAKSVAESECESNSSLRVLFIGRLSKTKGLHILLKAFQKVLKDVPRAKLDILGSGIDEAGFQNLTHELGLGNSVIFHGWADRARIQRGLKECAVVAFPSIYPEAFGIVGIEAMMHARPVVAFDVGGVKDWLDDGVSGCLIPVKDEEGLAGSITRLLKDGVESKKMGKAARLQALREFSVERHMKELLSIYHDAVNSVC